MEKHILCAVAFFLQKLPLCEVMWENMAELRMCIAY